MSDIYIGKSSYTYNEGRHDVFIVPCRLYKANNSVYINVPDNHYIAHNDDYVAMLLSDSEFIKNFEKFGFVSRGTDLYHTSNGSGTKITFGGDFAYVFEDYVLSFGKHQINGKLVWTIYLFGDVEVKFLGDYLLHRFNVLLSKYGNLCWLDYTAGNLVDILYTLIQASTSKNNVELRKFYTLLWYYVTYCKSNSLSNDIGWVEAYFNRR